MIECTVGLKNPQNRTLNPLFQEEIMQKMVIFVAIPILVLSFLVYSYSKDDRCPVKFREINMSPDAFANNNPMVYPAAASYLKASESPKWKYTYKYVILSDGSCDNFSGREYLQENPSTAVEATDHADGTSFVIFTNNPPDQKLFRIIN